jgi:ParB family chromosome partitioning protein
MLENESERVEYIPWVQIVPDPAQPREDIPPDHVERVADSIKKRGLLQYPRVRFDAALGKYVLIFGHCRWLAWPKAKPNDPVPCVVVSGEPTDKAILLDQITENELRQGLKPMALARALARVKSMKCTGEQIAAETGLSGASISRSLQLLTLPEDVQALVDAGEVPEDSAYYLSRLSDEAMIRKLAQDVAAGKLSRDKLAAIVRDQVGQGKPKATNKPEGWRLSHKLDSGVSVTVSAGGRTLTQDDVKAAVAFLNKEAKTLPKPAAEGDGPPPLAQAS